MNEEARAKGTQGDGAAVIDAFRLDFEPNYIAQDDEEGIFRAAFDSRIPLIVKGPTGCGKTRFIEHVAYELDLPLITVS